VFNASVTDADSAGLITEPDDVVTTKTPLACYTEKIILFVYGALANRTFHQVSPHNPTPMVAIRIKMAKTAKRLSQ